MKKSILLFALLAVSILGLKAQATVNVTNVTCYGLCNGSITVTAVGGSTYVWSNSATGATITGLCTGVYHCTVLNSQQLAIDTVSATVIQPGGITASNYATAANCGHYNGGIVPTVSGGTPPYAYEWSNGQNTPDVTNASPGTYCLTVVDANGCSIASCATIQQGASAITITDSLTIPAGCNACNGRVYTTITGANQPYSYLWNNTNNQVTPQLCPGVNTVVVTDAYHCTGTAQFIVPDSTGLTATATNTNVSCANPVDTTTVTATGGTGLLTFSWGDNSNPDVGVTSPRTHTYAAYGIYTIQVTQPGGCAAYIFDTVINHGMIATEVYNTQAYCSNPLSGALEIAVNGGTGPYTYIWNNLNTTDSLINVAAGNYAVTITDANGCTTTFADSIIQTNVNPNYYVYGISQPVSCGNNTGMAAGIVYGGQPPYAYLWSNSQTTDTITGIGIGTYQLSVTDADGCIAYGGAQVTSECYNVIIGRVFADANGNCTYDSGENILTATIVARKNQVTYYASNYQPGQYAILIPDTGTFTVSLEYVGGACNGFTPCGNLNNQVTFTALGDTSFNSDFASTVGTGYDLTMHPGWTQASPGFVKEYWVMGYNQSASPFTGWATIVFNYDSNLVYQSSLNQPPVVNLAAHTLTWQLNPVPQPYFDWTTRLRSFFLVPATLSPGYLLQSSFSITPASGDCDTTNNFMAFSEPCGGSHDPNLKTVSPSGPVDENDSILNYTIYFQNTGTASTHFISVADTLSPYLDPATVVNLASSAPYSNFGISGKGILTWTFNPYFLPDSLADAAGSKGFIKFSVKRRSNAPVSSVISNTASIYFDYNQPVVTNTVADTVITNAVPLGIAPVADKNIGVTAFPNPFNDFTNVVVTGIKQPYNFQLYDITGRLQQTIPSLNTNQFQLNRTGLADGVYFYRITVSNTQVAYGKVVVQR